MHAKITPYFMSSSLKALSDSVVELEQAACSEMGVGEEVKDAAAPLLSPVLNVAFKIFPFAMCIFKKMIILTKRTIGWRADECDRTQQP